MVGKRNHLGEDLLPGNPLITVTDPDFKRYNPNAKRWHHVGFKAIVRDPLFITTAVGLVALLATVIAL